MPTTRDLFGPPPSDDPVERAGHVVKVYMDPNVGGTTNESEPVVTATRNAYGPGVWTGMTWGDLQKLWALAEQAGPALELLREIDRELDSLKVPRQADSGATMSPPQRLMWLMVEPFKPRREDAVERWLKRMRDQREVPTGSSYADVNNVLKAAQWEEINRLLDRYRECSDYGLSLEPEDDGKGDR